MQREIQPIGLPPSALPAEPKEAPMERTDFKRYPQFDVTYHLITESKKQKPRHI